MNHWGATTCNLTGGTGWLYRSENSQAKFGWQDADGYHHPSTNCTSTANFGVISYTFNQSGWVKLSGLAGFAWHVNMYCV